jgi:hypothetical protein
MPGMHFARAQKDAKVFRVGMLSNWGPRPVFDALKSDLARFGYVEGKNVVCEARFPEGQLESFTDTSAGAPAAIDKILKGAKPADMPFELGTRREFVINLELGTRSRLDRSCRSPETCRSCHRIKKLRAATLRRWRRLLHGDGIKRY